MIMKLRLIIKILLLIFLILVAACEKRPPPLKILEGQAVPELAVNDTHGNPTRLSLANGKFTVLNVWATWCGPCRHEMPSLERLASSLDQQNFEVIGLSVDSDDHVVREFLIERKVGFRNFMDPEMSAANNIFGVRVFPSTFIFSPKGELLEVIEGWRDWDTDTMLKHMNRLAAG